MNVDQALPTHQLPVYLQTEQDWEDSTLLKVVACLPFIGFILAGVITDSLSHKIEMLPVPKDRRPHPILGKILDDSATSDKKETAIQRCDYLEAIHEDYTKSLLINSLLTVALAVSAVALNIIPLALGLFVGVGFTITSGIFTFCLCY